MKKLTITRGTTSYETRGLDTIFEREEAIQADCLSAIKAMVQEVDSKARAQDIAKIMIAVSALVHSDLERVLRQHGKETVENDPS